MTLPTVQAIVTKWGHGRARVRLPDGKELICRPASRVRGQLREGERVQVEIDVYGGGRIVAREDKAPERLKASERRRRRAAEEEPPPSAA